MPYKLGTLEMNIELIPNLDNRGSLLNLRNT
jgi:hypothetical protein